MRGESNLLLSFFIRLVSIVKHPIAARLVHRQSKVDLIGRLYVYSALASIVATISTIARGEDSLGEK